DVRDGGPLRHAREKAAEARALRDACLAFFPRAMLPALPLLDRAARRWLTRSRSPYVNEVEQVADTLGFPGVWLLNASYQWACTALAREEGGAPWLVRTLDWPFNGLGRHAEVARMRGDGGEFFSVTWPGYVGALTAMAPFRFAASINQAPMRRRTAHRWLRPYDFALNGIATRGACWRRCRSRARSSSRWSAAPPASAASSNAPRPATSRARTTRRLPTTGCRNAPRGK